MDKSSIDALAERVETLERENRLWRWGGGFFLIAVLVVMVGGAQRAADPKVVEAEQFIVRDKDGKERVRLGLTSDGRRPSSSEARRATIGSFSRRAMSMTAVVSTSMAQVRRVGYRLFWMAVSEPATLPPCS